MAPFAPRRPSTGRSHDPVTAGLVVYAAYLAGLAALMAVAPRLFYEHIGGFGVRNDHYIRDTATFEAALAVGLALAVRRPSWRVPVLGVVTVQFALHSINHLVDIGRAHPGWTGPADFATLAVSTALLAWLLTRAARGTTRPSAAGPQRGRARAHPSPPYAHPDPGGQR